MLNWARKWATLASLLSLLCALPTTQGQPLDPAWVDARSFESFAEAVAAATNRSLVVARPEVIKADLAIREDTHLIFYQGGQLVKEDPAQKITVQIAGPMTAPMTQVFSGFPPGAVRLSPRYLKEAYPQWWGAKGDGQHDDSLAIQSAIDSQVSSVYIPAGYYLIRKTLDITNRIFGLRIQGAGQSEAGRQSTFLVGDTGGIVIDTTGSRWLDFRDFRILARADQAAPSTVGILYARSEAGRFAEFNSLENVGVSLPSIPEANNSNGTIAVYNWAAEIWRARNVYFEADNAVVFTGYNIWGVESVYTTSGRGFAGYSSMSCCTIDGASTLRGRKGVPVTLDNTARIEITGAYLCGDARVQDASPYAVVVAGKGSWNVGVRITGLIERKEAVLSNSRHIIGLTLDVTTGGAAPAVHNSGTIVDGQIDLRALDGTPRSRQVFTSDSEGTISQSTLDIPPGYAISAPGLLLRNVTIRSNCPLEELRRSVTVADGSVYFLSGFDATQ